MTEETKTNQDTSTHLRNTAVYLVTVVLTQLVGFALLPVITRFLGPESYGAYALALAVSQLIGMVASSWIRNVAFRYYFEARRDGTTRSFYLSLVVLQFVTVAAAFGASAFVLPLLGQEMVSSHVLLAAAAMIVAGDFQAMTLSFVRAEQRSGHFAAAELTAAVTRFIGTLVGLLFGFRDPAFLLLAAAGASVIGSLVAWHGLASTLLGVWRLSVVPMNTVGRHVFGALPFSLGEWIGNLSDRLVLNAFVSVAAVGIYSAGFSLGDRIIGGLVMAVFMMAWPDVLAAFDRDGYGEARHAIRRYFQIFLWLTTGPLVALIIFGDTIVALLGSGYAGSVSILGFIAAAAWLRGLSKGFNRHFELEKRFHVLSTVTVIGALLNLSLNLWLVPWLEVTGAGISALTTQAVVAVVYISMRNKELVSFPWSDLLLVAATCAGAALVIPWIAGVGIGAVLTFAVVYLLVMVFIWRPRLQTAKGG